MAREGQIQLNQLIFIRVICEIKWEIVFYSWFLIIFVAMAKYFMITICWIQDFSC